MNRIILIGNGFDLAHGMKTSYSDFIDAFWEQKKENIIKHNSINYQDDDIVVEFNYSQSISNPSDRYIISKFQEILNHKHIHIIYKNKFLEKITLNNSLKNWVDIEYVFYELLKSSYNEKNKDNNVYYGKIDQLNSDFNQIKNYLKEYLKRSRKKF